MWICVTMASSRVGSPVWGGPTRVEPDAGVRCNHGGMRIGELAQASGVSVRSLRYYEQLGLIRSERTARGWRMFDADMVERVILIQHLLAAGLCGVTIGELLPCLDAPSEQRTGEMERLLAREVERLEDRRRDIDRELDVLRALQAEV